MLTGLPLIQSPPPLVRINRCSVDSIASATLLYSSGTVACTSVDATDGRFWETSCRVNRGWKDWATAVAACIDRCRRCQVGGMSWLCCSKRTCSFHSCSWTCSAAESDGSFSPSPGDGSRSRSRSSAVRLTPAKKCVVSKGSVRSEGSARHSALPALSQVSLSLPLPLPPLPLPLPLRPSVARSIMAPWVVSSVRFLSSSKTLYSTLRMSSRTPYPCREVNSWSSSSDPMCRTTKGILLSTSVW
mmetsp:Transcript_3323/g.9203  ORF Transcript_3323/g.9203 Transcript_3323/m.9203 type:complete len:244 (+) Transcript_3323:786-1517(+)